MSKADIRNPLSLLAGVGNLFMMPVMDGIAATKAIRAMDRADAKTLLVFCI